MDTLRLLPYQAGVGASAVQPQPIPCTETLLATTAVFPSLNTRTAVLLGTKSATACVNAARPPLMKISTTGRSTYTRTCTGTQYEQPVGEANLAREDCLGSTQKDFKSLMMACSVFCVLLTSSVSPLRIRTGGITFWRAGGCTGLHW